MRLMPAEAQS